MMSKSDRYLATIRASILTRIVYALDLAISDTNDLLAQHGLLRSQLLDPYASVPLRPYSALLEAAASRTGDKEFGLRIGAMLRPIDLGPAGLLLSTAPTLRLGIERFGRYIATIQSATQVGLHDDGAWAAWIYKVEDPTVWPRVQDSELTMATMCTLFRARLGPRWAPLEVHFEHGGADRGLALRKFFRARIRFDQPFTQVLIASADLDRPLRTEDAEVTPALERHAQDLLARQMESEEHSLATLTEQARRIIVARLHLERISVASIARDLGLSTRSLQRGLAAHGTTMRNLLREVRRELAEQRLDSGKSSHASIAQAIGYSDTTVFWRAFKRWSGTTPRAFRERSERNPCDNETKPSAQPNKPVRRRRTPRT